MSAINNRNTRVNDVYETNTCDAQSLNSVRRGNITCFKAIRSGHFSGKYWPLEREIKFALQFYSYVK